MPSPSSENFLDRSLLQQLAGPKAFARGESYFAENRVRQLQASMDRATAKVSGSRTYRVKLWQQRGQLHHACTCAAGREEAFCKHCAAVGLAWLAALQDHASDGGTQHHGTGQPQPRPADAEAGISREQLRDYLRGLDKDRLVSLTLEATDYDDILHRRILLELIGVAPAGGGKRKDANPAPAPARTPPDLELYKHLLHEAIECADYVDSNAMGDYAQGVEEAIQPLGDLLKNGHAAAVVELAEFALLELDRSSEMIDTGDGALNAIYDDLQQYHLEACRVAKPDPEALAARLLTYELEGGLGVFNNAINTYAEALGPMGVAAWRRLLIQEWSRLPVVGAGTGGGHAMEEAQSSIDYRRFQLNALMERVARSAGDTDALIAVKQRDLTSAHDFLALADLHLSAGRPEEAVQWAERGVAAFPGAAAGSGLNDLLVSIYARLGRHEEALQLLWKEFAQRKNLDEFHQLKEYFSRQRAEDWPEWRRRAVDLLHAAAPAGDRSLLVEVLLEEGLDEEAWNEAKTGGCRPDLLLDVAGRRERTHPAEALRVYQDQLGPIIARGDQHAYKEAISLLTRIGDLLDRLGRGDDFGTYRAEVRAANRQKRSFLKLLDGIQPPPPGQRGSASS